MSEERLSPDIIYRLDLLAERGGPDRLMEEILAKRIRRETLFNGMESRIPLEAEKEESV